MYIDLINYGSSAFCGLSCHGSLVGVGTALAWFVPRALMLPLAVSTLPPVFPNATAGVCVAGTFIGTSGMGVADNTACGCNVAFRTASV